MTSNVRRPLEPVLYSLCVLLGCSETVAPSYGGSVTVTTRAEAGLEGATVCVGSDEAFVRRAVTHLLGRRVLGTAELQVLLDLYREVGPDRWLDALMETPEFIDTWEQALRDVLIIPRMGPLGCRGTQLLSEDGPELAEFLLENGPEATFTRDGAATPFATRDVIRSTLALDDMTPLLRVEPFMRAGTTFFEVEDVNDEIDNRRINASVFERAYLNRRLDCMQCHNSEYSITGSDDPAKDRTWEIPGHFERALFEAPVGRAVADFDALFRINGVKIFKFVADAPNKAFWQNGDGVSPWGLSKACGQFAKPGEIETDPAGSDGFFVKGFGKTASLYDLEAIMRQGFAALRERGLERGPDLAVEGSLATAWLISAAFSERVFEHITGRRLTVAHAFPRNKAQRDLIESFARTFSESGFSLRALVKAILQHPLVNLGAPADCGDAVYTLPAVFDPFTPAEEDPSLRPNSAGDAVVRVPPIILLRSVHLALGWPLPTHEFEFDPVKQFEGFTVSPSFILMRDIGTFVTDAELGFRGASLQEALAWEHAMGTCTPPDAPAGDLAPDFITTLVAEAPTLRDAVIALKDRLLADPVVDDEELALMAPLLGAPLSSTPGAHEPGLRRLCVALLRAADLHLEGAPTLDRAALPPPWAPSGADRAAWCARWRPLFSAEGESLASCPP